MDILFSSDSLRDLCNNENKRRKKWGKDRATRVGRRLDDMRDAANLGILRNAPGRYHELKGDRQGQVAADLDHPYRLVFEPADDPIPRKPDGGLDWDQVKTVRILEVEDYHG